MLDNRQLDNDGSIFCTEGSSRVDLWLAERLPFLSRSAIQKLIRTEKILINHKPCRPKDPLVSGDLVFVPPNLEKQNSDLQPISMALTIVYEDEELLVVDKPKSLKVHPGAGEEEPTLVHGLLAHTKGKLSRRNHPKALDRPGIVHRIDKDTSGLLVCAKTDEAHDYLAKQFSNKTNLREYLTLLDGCLPGPGPVIRESYLARDPKNRLRFASLPFEQKELGKYAKSRFERQATYGDKITFAKVILFTGRTHQIRVHSLDLKVPILGDPLYNTPKTWTRFFDEKTRKALSSMNRQMLHAARLGFVHPKTEQFMEFYSDLPDDFANMMKLLEPYSKN